MKVIVAGGVAAGMSAASKIIRIQKDAQVTVYEKGGYLSYGACGLSYYVAGYNDDHTKMIARTRAAFEEMGISTFLHHEIIAVDAQNKVVTVKNLKTGETFKDIYDKLMIGTGASAIKPPIPGIEKKGIYVLKTMEDGLRLKEVMAGYGIQNVVVVGGGYIGVEVAEAMHALGKNVVCIEAADKILAPFDDEITAIAMQELQDKGIEVHTGEKVMGFGGTESVNEVITDQRSYVADLVVVSAGVRPNTQLLAGTDVALEKNGAVIVDREMRTSNPDIFSAGDCAMVYDLVKQKNVYLPLGTAANKCGRIAGTNICGGHDVFVGMTSSAALKVCDMQLGRTGLGEREAIDMGYTVGSVTIEGRNHPAYFPGMEPLTIKVIYEKPSMRILGAQLAGKDGAALRTDVFVVAINAGMTTKQLGMMDLIYSPPYAGVWDAIQIACNAAK
ncbi:CoA-disulfide reductase [Christensenella timonensis]|uniref:CoA-disulfide reductase n=1 Tax=Christensenella timonensis TaxID=1816678 RepID=UPI00082BA669|nr:CoA-disulfide reductase [Christensenella timonensis]